MRSAPRPPPEGSALDRGDDTLDKIEPAEGVGAAAQKVECRTVRGRVKAADKGSIINKRKVLNEHCCDVPVGVNNQ